MCASSHSFENHRITSQDDSHNMSNPNNKISITVCGDGGCGKSSITLRLVRSEWVNDYDREYLAYDRPGTKARLLTDA